MPSLFLIIRYVICVLASATITGTAGKPVGSIISDTNTSLTASETVFVKPSYIPGKTLNNCSEMACVTISTHVSPSPANLTATPEVNINMAKDKPEEYTCEHAERLVKEKHARRCGSVSAFFRARCWYGIPKNCCIKGKGPATCTCHVWWPREAPRKLTTGQYPHGSSCLFY